MTPTPGHVQPEPSTTLATSAPLAADTLLPALTLQPVAAKAAQAVVSEHRPGHADRQAGNINSSNSNLSRNSSIRGAAKPAAALLRSNPPLTVTHQAPAVSKVNSTASYSQRGKAPGRPALGNKFAADVEAKAAAAAAKYQAQQAEAKAKAASELAKGQAKGQAKKGTKTSGLGKLPHSRLQKTAPKDVQNITSKDSFSVVAALKPSLPVAPTQEGSKQHAAAGVIKAHR